MSELNSALTCAEWKQLEHDVFDDAPEAIQRIRAYARAQIMSPVATLILCSQWALTSLPGNVTFNAGYNDGSPNLFVALVGSPGMGKDSHIAATRRGMRVFKAHQPVEPRQLSFGSGEGLVTALNPGKDEDMAAPVLFGTGEVSTLSTLMGRTGSTLRSQILDMYSGNPLGYTNKAETVTVPANTYTAGLWVGVQPDKAGMLLEGEDDGLKHRFVWTELIDPNAPNTAVEDVRECHAVLVPQCLIDGTGGFTFDDFIVEQTRAENLAKRRTGHTGENSGHRNQTRAKLACGLALLSSRGHVTLDDWQRAGHLMGYSDKIQAYCLQHLESRRVEDSAKRMAEREEAEEENRRNRIRIYKGRIVQALLQGSDEKSLRWGQRRQSFAYKYRTDADAALDELISRGEVVKVLSDDGRTDVLERGARFDEAVKNLRGTRY